MNPASIAVANAGDADLAMLARAHPERYPFLLQSVATGAAPARYDILFAFPGATLELAADGRLTGPHAGSTGFLAALDDWWRSDGAAVDTAEPETAELGAAEVDSSPPFNGGWFVYLGYELAQEVEPRLQLTPPSGQPVAFATRVRVALVRDRQCNEIQLIAEPGAESHLQQVRADLENLRSPREALPAALQIIEDPEEQFLRAVARARDYIAAGDVFQANLSRTWRAEYARPPIPADLYARLCESNPAPFSGLVQRPDFAIVSSSPERLVRRRGQRVETRPIAGTRPRDEAPAESPQRRAELLGHPKERAEHIMLIDLERNDLGRVCVGGSVHVDEYMTIESYSHVHHIVSNVSGILRDGVTPGELIRAVFPGGTITGCPKVRCMELIHELEQRSRGAYTGSMGYLDRNGDCDFNILIRTMTLTGNTVEIAAGSGIVADSEPQRELEETRAKARGMLLALEAVT